MKEDDERPTVDGRFLRRRGENGFPYVGRFRYRRRDVNIGTMPHL